MDVLTKPDPAPDPAQAPSLAVGLMVHDFPRLSETFVINQARGLLDAGHDVTVLAPYGDGAALRSEAGMHADVAAYGLAARADYAPLGEAPLRWTRTGGPLRAPSRAAAFLNEAVLFGGRRFDVVHCQFASLGLLALRHARARTLRWRRLVVHLRGYDVSAFVRDRGEDVYAPLWRAGDLFVANCEHFRQRAISLGCPAERTIVIGSSIETKNFPAKTDYRLDADDLRVITVGRLTEKKGIPTVLRALARSRGAGSETTLDVVGDGPLDAELRALAQDLGIRDAVRFHGALPHDRIAALLRASDVLVAASERAPNGDQDAPVNSLKEAMVSGLPVIGTRHGGIPELVLDPQSGCLVDERDDAGLADAFARIADRRAEWPRIGQANRARATEMYEHARMTRRLIAAYMNTLETGDPA